MFERLGRNLSVAALAILAGLSVTNTGWAQRSDVRRTELRGTLKAVDAPGKSITVAVGSGREEPVDKVYPLAESVEVAVGGGGFARGVSVFQQARVEDLPSGAFVLLTLTPDEKSVESILADEPTIRGVIQSVDAGAKTIAVSLGRNSREEPETVRTLAVADGAEIAIDEGRGRRFGIREAKLGELKAGSSIVAWLSLDGKQLRAAMTEGPTISGTIGNLDAGTRTLTLTTRPARGDDAGEVKTLVIAPDASVLADDGRGRRLSLKAAKLADIPKGSVATVRLSVDQSQVTQIRAEGPAIMGMLKSVDAGKNTVTVSLRAGRGEPDEERTIEVAKDARINSDGADIPLSDLKPANEGPFVMLRLSLDQTKVQSVLARQSGQR